MVRILTIEVVLHVVFARPQQLHWPPYLFGDLPRFRRIVPLIAPAERSTTVRHVDRYLLSREPRKQSDFLLQLGTILSGRPHLDAILAHVHRGVHWFHGGMGLEGQLVERIDFLGVFLKRLERISLVYRDKARRSRGLRFKLLAEGFGCIGSVWPLVPGDLQRPATLNSRPRRVAYYGHPTCGIDVAFELRKKAEGRNRKNGANTGTALAELASKLCSLPPKCGQRATTANSIPGTRTSMPNAALPSTLLGMSTRGTDLPITRNSEGDFKAIASALGTGSFEAVANSSPYFTRRPLGPCTTVLFSARQSFFSTPQFCAAAVRSISRA